MLPGTRWRNDRIAQNAGVEGAGGINTPTDTSNPFTTLRNVKNPGIDAAAQSVLGQINSLSGPQPDTVIRSTRSQPLADRLSSEFHNFDTDREGNRSSLADFTSSFMAAAPQNTALTNQEIGSVGEFYDGTVRGELDKLAGARRIATAGALSPAIQAVLRNRNMGALLGGNDSYLDRQVLDKGGDLARAAAVDNAEQLKQNYLYSREGQNRLLGARSNLLNNDLMRGIVPTEVGQRINQNDLSRLYGIGAAENANTNYRVTNPQTELAIKLGLLGDASRIDLANTFYGLRKPYEPNVAGLIPSRVGGPVYSGGGGYSPAADAILRSPPPTIGQPNQNVAAGRGGGLTPAQEFQFFQQYGEWPYGSPPAQQVGYGPTPNPIPLSPWEKYPTEVPWNPDFNSQPDYWGGSNVENYA